LKSIAVRGLMAIAPIGGSAEDSRPYFKDMYTIFTKVRALKPEQIYILSMGMTDDYKVALEEGSTMIRVGTGIFGHRK
jgi:PLP dependent protein